MGVDIYVRNDIYCRARWGYGGFYRYRNELADIIDEHGIEENASLIKFFNQSDCQAELYWKDCEELYPILEATLPYLTEINRDKTIELIKSMKKTVELGTALVFC